MRLQRDSNQVTGLRYYPPPYHAGPDYVGAAAVALDIFSGKSLGDAPKNFWYNISMKHKFHHKWMTFEERFNLWKGEPNECWIWQGALTNGYGVLRVKGKTRQAHRMAYELAEGPIPEGHQLDHLCRTRACFNPAHLEPILPIENMARGTMPWAVARRLGLCSKGHTLPPNHKGSCRTCRLLYRFNRGETQTFNPDRPKRVRTAPEQMRLRPPKVETISSSGGRRFHTMST